jgi:hypothetical protein
MLSPQSRKHAGVLRTLLNDGAPAGLDPITPTPGVQLPFEDAVRIALADVEHLTELIEDGHDVSTERWRRLAAELETLTPGRPRRV